MSHDDLKERARAAAIAAFGDSWQVDSWAIAPGRIELIGNHVDYNGGPVLAAAIDRVIALGAGAIDDTISIAVVAPDATDEVGICQPATLGDWQAGPDDQGPIVYVKGVVASLLQRSIPIRLGVGIAYAGDIPPGFGMSSSAAFCLATILALTADDLPATEMVAIAREAEHRAGAMVGAMDQSASVAGNVIVFDGTDNSFATLVPDLGDLAFAVASSGVDRSLRTSSYGRRVQESGAALAAINAHCRFQLRQLAEAADHWDELEPQLPQIMDETLARRVRHVATESLRVRQAEAAVRANNWVAFGQLMNASGRSSAGDYEISHPIVEELVTTVHELDGVLGARMMGGGEGGPALILLRKDAASAIASRLEATFYARHPLDRPRYGGFQLCEFGPGAHREPVA